ncbi:hypothetical protein LEP48_00360 [Isoptericola sp. NEAU-Y5]|uniref:Uncharacterized protein n=1 Tax=Isoptericola luteus TaxID=2879484 RepID=A0ABS7ZBF3_9MICO|nr:hypothetical protein [Isoptericola sp. NEAU-Y5]MCA5891802.1 hypothetical protein [Isoptericola sp. NEAU-Y5]
MSFIDWGALMQVLVAGLILGAGAPALFALGLRLLAGTAPVAPEGAAAASSDGEATASATVTIARPTPVRLVGAIACLGVVVGAVAFGLVFVVSGGH